MKPDNFDDNIRRKLDGIEPVFREKDWAQMQQVMRQHGMITPWSAAPSWLLPTAGVVSVAALLTTTVWLGQSNQQLRQDVQRLSQTVTQLKQTSPAAPPTRIDTVYLTRLVPAPTNNPTNAQSIEPNVSVPQLTPTRDKAVATQSQTNALTNSPDADRLVNRPTVASQAPTEPRLDRTQPNAPEQRSNSNPLTDRTNPTAGTPDAPNRRIEPTERSGVGTVPADASGNRVAQETGTNRNASGTNRANTDRSVGSSGRVETGTSPATSDRVGAVTAPGGRNTIRPDANGVGEPAGTSTEATAPVAIEKLASRPMPVASSNFEEGISRAIRRLRRLYPAKALPALPVSPTTAPEATAVVTPTDRFRLGPAAELGLKQWSLGVYSDVLLGRHFLLGLGLERVNISGGEFETDMIFFNRTKRDFRRDYAGGIDKRYDIIAINRRSLTWQVPITLGYRLPLVYGIALTPSVGFSTSLTAREIVSFSYQRGPYDYQEVQLADRRPVNWYHSWSASVGVEKRWGPVTVQASPYLVGPFADSPLGLNGTSGGLRLRTLYSF